MTFLYKIIYTNMDIGIGILILSFFIYIISIKKKVIKPIYYNSDIKQHLKQNKNVVKKEVKEDIESDNDKKIKKMIDDNIKNILI